MKNARQNAKLSLRFLPIGRKIRWSRVHRDLFIANWKEVTPAAITAGNQEPVFRG